jgi:hypothetical protein
LAQTPGVEEAEEVAREPRAVWERMAAAAAREAVLEAVLVEQAIPVGARRAVFLEGVVAAARRTTIPMSARVAPGGMGKSESRGPERPAEALRPR